MIDLQKRDKAINKVGGSKKIISKNNWVRIDGYMMLFSYFGLIVFKNLR